MNIAFIPVRGGSKSIPLKNIKIFAGKPLVYWCAKAANDAKSIDKVVIATDNEEIKNTVLKFNLPKINIFDRCAENATDNASTESVMLEYIHTKNNLRSNDKIFLIQATSPLLSSITIDDMWSQFLQSGKDSALSAVRNKRFFWTSDGVPMNYDYKARPRRQDFSGLLMENGAVYINSVKNIMNNKCRLSGTIFIYEMPEYMGLEIDEPDDWLILEIIKKRQQLKKTPHNKVFCIDIDGVLGRYADIKDMNQSYINNKPNQDIIAVCNHLYDSGNSIIVYTARGSGSGIDWSKETEKQLKDWGLKYHELHFGKPPATYYIDDKMLDLNLFKLLGKS